MEGKDGMAGRNPQKGHDRRKKEAAGKKRRRKTIPGEAREDSKKGGGERYIARRKGSKEGENYMVQRWNMAETMRVSAGGQRERKGKGLTEDSKRGGRRS